MDTDNLIGSEIIPLKNPYTIVNDLNSVLVYIQEAIITQSDTGTTTKVWENKHTNNYGYEDEDIEYKCIIEVNTKRDSENLASPYNLVTHTIYFNPDTEIDITNRIIRNGVIYEILVIEFMTTGELRKVYCQQLNQ